MQAVRNAPWRPTASTARAQLRVAVLIAAMAVLGTPAMAVAKSSAPNPVTITLYSGQHVQTTDALVAHFEKANPSIHVAVRSDDEALLDNQIVVEGSRSPADVIFTENSPALEFLQQHKLLTTVSTSTLADTPSKFNSPQGDWVGVSARVSVLVYNPRLISKAKLPTAILQLANPRYNGKLAFAPSETDFQPIVTSVLSAYGKSATLSWLNGVKANSGGHSYANSETVVNDVNRGMVAFGLINQYYWYRLRAEIGASNMHSAIAYLAPRDPGYIIDVSGAAVLASSKHQVAAQKFVAFLVSKSGQEIIAHSISFEYPIASGVVTPQPETPFHNLKPYPIDLSQLGTGASAIALLQQAQLL